MKAQSIIARYISAKALPEPGSLLLKSAIFLFSLYFLLPAFASRHISVELMNQDLTPVATKDELRQLQSQARPHSASLTPDTSRQQASLAGTGTTPKSLLVYYGWPSSFNYSSNFWDLTKVAADFSRYDFIVLGAGLELSSHGDHLNTGTILSKINQQISTTGRRISIFGYLDLGRSTNDYSQAEIGQRIDLWLQLFQGFSHIDAGIFFDDYGYDFGTDRARQSYAVNYAKSLGLAVIVNAWDPDDVFGADINTSSYMGTMMNPNGNPPPSGIDYYLSESFVIKNSNWAGQNALESKQAKLTAYQASYNLNPPMQVLSLTTNSNGYSFSQQQFDYAWHYAGLYNHAAFGWGEPAFSSNAVAPFRTRPPTNFNFPPLQLPQSTTTGPCIYREPAANFHGIMIHPQAHISVSAPDLTSLLNNLNSAFSTPQCQY
ncbi:hypothetical protein SG34_005205 [Thalassomonas viridans]|uniref:Uncharacterized protein n=1 Tax=Thalassomonas viridans TaxID=137584 RepID=A0AAE9Z6T3_9GAMM|nr:hypothetical protein [Thalassomonas viridans]WDE06323.1 hypothetical protein SG34_005205 [Thalassomonas viridans]